MSTVARVAYMYGILEGQNDFDPQKISKELDDDLDLIYKYWEKIADDWKNRIDISDIREEAFVGIYAERKMLEQFGKGAK